MQNWGPHHRGPLFSPQVASWNADCASTVCNNSPCCHVLQLKTELSVDSPSDASHHHRVMLPAASVGSAPLLVVHSRNRHLATSTNSTMGHFPQLQGADQ